MSDPTNPNNNTPFAPIPKPAAPTKSDQVKAILDLTLNFMQKRLHKNGNVYLVDSTSRKVFFIDDESVFNTITELALRNNLIISNSAIQTAKRVLKSQNYATPSKINLRIGLGQHAYFLDFADGVHFIRYSAEGAEKVILNPQNAHSIDVDFLRPANLAPIAPLTNWGKPAHAVYLNSYDEKETANWLLKRTPYLNQLLSIINIPERYYSVVISWMVCTLLPERSQTVLEITGEESSGKSTAAWIIKSLIDPADKTLNEIPNSTKELLSIAQNSHIVAIDNADELSEVMQRKLFELLTSGVQIRANYGNSGNPWTITIRKPIIVTSTSSMLSNKHLAKQSISIELPNLHEGKHAQLINEQFLENHPYALLELSRIAGYVLSNPIPSPVKVNGHTYFDNFTLTGAAVCSYYGIEVSEFITTSNILKNDINDNIIDRSAVARSLLLWASEYPESRTKKPLNQWHKELKELLSDEEHDDWPKTTRRFGAELKKIAPRLNQKGITCETLGKQGSHVHWEIQVA